MFENKSMTDWAKINCLRDMAIDSFRVARQLTLRADPKTVPIAYLDVLNQLELQIEELNLDPNQTRYTDF